LNGYSLYNVIRRIIHFNPAKRSSIREAKIMLQNLEFQPLDEPYDMLNNETKIETFWNISESRLNRLHELYDIRYVTYYAIQCLAPYRYKKSYRYGELPSLVFLAILNFFFKITKLLQSPE